MIAKSAEEIKLLKKAGNIVYQTHQYLKPYLKVGITTKELDSLAEKYIRNQGATPSFKGYGGFPASICTSINDAVVHGIPNDYKLQDGDIISIDIGACYKGYHGDSAWTYAIGKIDAATTHLLEHTLESLYKGLEQVKAGNHVGDIGYAIEKYAKEHQLSVIRELVGHGVGKNIHEKPDIPNYGNPHTGPVLVSGMVIAIEPMLNLGKRHVVILDDEWTIVTRDGSLSAHYEHTVLVTDSGYLILTGE